MTITTSTPKNYTGTTERIKNFRCPGCFKWTSCADAEVFPVGSLDDKNSYTLCPRCALIMDNEEIAKPHLVRAIKSNIGKFAGGAR